MPWLLNGAGSMLTRTATATPPGESNILIMNRLDDELMRVEGILEHHRQVVQATEPATSARIPRQDKAKSHGARLAEPLKSKDTTLPAQSPPVKQMLVQPAKRFDVSRRSTARSEGLLSATLGTAESSMTSAAIETPVSLTPVDTVQSVSSSSDELTATLLDSGQSKPSAKLGQAGADGAKLAAIHLASGSIGIEKGSEPEVKAGKEIRRIIIFYHDGSFSDYQPE